MKIETRTAGKVKILDLHGNITTGIGTKPVGDALESLYDAGEKRIVLNLKHVKRIDSGGLGMLMANKRKADANKATVKFLMPSKEIYDLLIMVRLTELYDLYDKELNAVGSF
jgi:anti-anti-sigma factor